MKYEELVDYYDRELTYLRRAGVEFAKKHPKIAQRLDLQSAEVPDPHVERLLEGVAFLTARIQRKIDDDFSELSQALLGVLYPHYLAPVPSLCVVQFNADGSQGKTTHGQLIPRTTQVFSRQVANTRCRFRTCYDVTLWPLVIEDAKVTSPDPLLTPPLDARTCLRITLETTQGIDLRELSLKTLRFFVHSKKRQSHLLLEFLLHQANHVAFVSNDGPHPEQLYDAPARECIAPVGFSEQEDLLPYDPRSLSGYRTLLEYLAFPEKFLFFDLSGFEHALARAPGQRIDLLFYSDRPFPEGAEDLNGQEFRLGCTPLVNLFRQSAMPILLKHFRHEYRVVPDRFRHSTMEVYSITSVKGMTATSRAEGEFIEYAPFYSTNHAGLGEVGETFWFGSRRDSTREGYAASDVYLTFVNLDFDIEVPASESIIVETLCSNGELPSQLPFGENRNDFNIEGQAVGDIQCLTKPTESLRSALGRGVQWRLISHLLVNLQSIVDPRYGRQTLQEVLTLYDFRKSAVNRHQIEGIVSVEGKPIAAQVAGEGGIVGMARGLEVSIELDPSRFVGSGVYLFASVLEHFLANFVSMNSFSKLSVRLKGKEGYLKQWPPRSGNQSLL